MADLASDPLAWRPVKAPSLAELEVLGRRGVSARLPKGFRALCADLVIQVDDFPSDEVLTEMQAETEFDLLGLFQGIGLPFRSESAAGADAEHDLAVPAADPGLLGRARRDAWAPSSSTCWCTRSAIISACRTPTWKRSNSQPMKRKE